MLLIPKAKANATANNKVGKFALNDNFIAPTNNLRTTKSKIGTK